MMKLWDKIVKGVTPDDEEPFSEDFSDDEMYYGGDNAGNMGDNIGDFMVSG